MGAPLEDARQLAQRYDRVRQEAEAQVMLFEFARLIYMQFNCHLAILGKSKLHTWHMISYIY